VTVRLKALPMARRGFRGLRGRGLGFPPWKLSGLNPPPKALGPPNWNVKGMEKALLSFSLFTVFYRKSVNKSSLPHPAKSIFTGWGKFLFWM